MKLIIDIPDEYFEQIKNNTEGSTAESEAVNAIRNGISYKDRPQGKWLDHSEEGYVECPICNCLTNCDDNIDELHYCWNCGAYMRRGGTK